MNIYKDNIVFEITDQVIDVGGLINQMKNAGAGALSIFLGKRTILNSYQALLEIILKEKRS